jgi:hypothetical protein
MEANFVIQDSDNVKHMVNLIDNCSPKLQVIR